LAAIFSTFQRIGAFFHDFAAPPAPTVGLVHCRSPVMQATVFVLTLAFAAAAAAEPDRSHLAALSGDELKARYLECDRRSRDAMLGGADAAECSMLHEELKHRVFGGDYARLLAWWQMQRKVAASR
jgi:hypothetical protein